VNLPPPPTSKDSQTKRVTSAALCHTVCHITALSAMLGRTAFVFQCAVRNPDRCGFRSDFTFSLPSATALYLLLVGRRPPTGHTDVALHHYLLDESVAIEAEEEHLSQRVDQVAYHCAGVHIHGVNLWTCTEMCNCSSFTISGVCTSDKHVNKFTSHLCSNAH
jgi:hypothetical protein